MIDFLEDIDLIGRNTKILYRMSRVEHKNIGIFKKPSFSFGEETWLDKSVLTRQQQSQLRMREGAVVLFTLRFDYFHVRFIIRYAAVPALYKDLHSK